MEEQDVYFRNGSSYLSLLAEILDFYQMSIPESMDIAIFSKRESFQKHNEPELLYLSVLVLDLFDSPKVYRLPIGHATELGPDTNFYRLSFNKPFVGRTLMYFLDRKRAFKDNWEQVPDD